MPDVDRMAAIPRRGASSRPTRASSSTPTAATRGARRMARARSSAPSRRSGRDHLIGDKGAKLYVRGTVSGMFTVYSPTDIEIENDLVYAQGSARDADLARFPRVDLGARHQGRERADHRRGRPARPCRVVRAPALLIEIGANRQARHALHARQPDRRHASARPNRATRPRWITTNGSNTCGRRTFP